jgi:DNA-binding MarR family transcriptional regulator
MAQIRQKGHNNKITLELEVAKIFCGNYKKELSSIEISKKLKIPKRTVTRKLNSLEEKGFLNFKRMGRNKIFSLDMENPQLLQFLVLIESYKTNLFLLKNPKIALLLENFPGKKIIFGSYAKSLQSKDSDLDLILFQKENSEIKNICKNFSPEIHLQFSSLKELDKKLKDENTLALEILNDHIILEGFEEIIKLFLENS